MYVIKLSIVPCESAAACLALPSEPVPPPKQEPEPKLLRVPPPKQEPEPVPPPSLPPEPKLELKLKPEPEPKLLLKPEPVLSL